MALETLDANNAHVGFQCTKCGKVIAVEDGKPEKEFIAEECPKEDSNQAAARIVREATKD